MTDPFLPLVRRRAQALIDHIMLEDVRITTVRLGDHLKVFGRKPLRRLFDPEVGSWTVEDEVHILNNDASFLKINVVVSAHNDGRIGTNATISTYGGDSVFVSDVHNENHPLIDWLERMARR